MIANAALQVDVSVHAEEWQIPERYTGIYPELFWRAYLGHAYELWRVLVVTQQRIQLRPQAERQWPPVYQLADHLGYGTRHAVTGRAASAAHPGQESLLDRLTAERLVVVWRDGEGRQVRYRYDVCQWLPCLTPYQVGQLSRPLQDDHAGILREMYPAQLCRRWHQIGARSLLPFLIPPLPIRARRAA